MPIVAVNIIKVLFVIALFGFLFYVARSMRGHIAGPPIDATPAPATPSTRDPQPPAAASLSPGERSLVFVDAAGETRPKQDRLAVFGALWAGQGLFQFLWFPFAPRNGSLWLVALAAATIAVLEGNCSIMGAVLSSP